MDPCQGRLVNVGLIRDFYSEVHIHEKQTQAIGRAVERAGGAHLAAIEKEGRKRHLEDFIGLWNAAVDTFRDVTTTMMNKHKSTTEYEIHTGSSVLLQLEEGMWSLRQNDEVEET